MRSAVSYLSLQFFKLQLRVVAVLVVVFLAVAVAVAEVFCTLSCKAHTIHAQKM